MTALHDAADPAKASQQRAYMKSEMPYYGVTVPHCRKIAKSVFKANPLPDADAWEASILGLWRKAKYREERYAAIELLLYKPYLKWIAPDRIALIEELVVTGAWWDYVDGIASYAMGNMLADHPKPTKPLLRAWAKDKDIWKRRTAILAQLGFKQATDEKLLFDVIAPSIGEPEFFLRKGIGWALREYSKTAPDAVIRYVEAHADSLSGLSKREALKHVQRHVQREHAR